MGAAVAVVAPMLMGGGAMGGLMGGSMLSPLLGGVLSNMLGGANGSGGMAGITQALQGFSPVNVLNATTNLIGTVMGGGAQQAAQTLQREDGMPKFVQDAVNQAVDKILKELKKPTDGADQALCDCAQKDIQESVDDIANKIVDSVRRQMSEATSEGGKECCGTGGAKKGAKSWLQAIAQAMGEAMGNKAAKMVELSNKLKEQSSAGGDEKAQAKSAKEMQATNAEFTAVSQEFKLLTDAFSTAIKSLGEGMSTMARKQ